MTLLCGNHSISLFKSFNKFSVLCLRNWSSKLGETLVLWQAGNQLHELPVMTRRIKNLKEFEDIVVPFKMGIDAADAQSNSIPSRNDNIMTDEEEELILGF